MQTSYSSPNKYGYPGDIVSENKRVKGGPAVENLTPGTIGAYVGTAINGIQNPSSDKIIFSTALSSSNVIDGTVTWKTIDDNGNEVVNTDDIASVTYASSNANTLNLLKAAIELLDSKLTATVSGSDSIIVTHDDYGVVILSDFAVTGGSAVTVAYAFSGTLLGPIQRQPMEQNSDGTTDIKPREMAGCMTQGIMTIYSEDAMNLGSSMYAQFIDNGAILRGAVRTTSDSSKATAFSTLKPASSVSADSNGNVEINNP